MILNFEIQLIETQLLWQRDDRKNIWEFPQKRKLCRGFPPQLLATNIILKGHIEVPGFGPRVSLRCVGWRVATFLEFYRARALQDNLNVRILGPRPANPRPKRKLNSPLSESDRGEFNFRLRQTILARK